MPSIAPLKEPGYEYPQSKTDILPKLPVRGLVLAPGSGGKTTMLTRLLVDKQFYGGRFSRIYWLSPSATVDDSLDPLREYVKTLQDQEEDPTLFDREHLHSIQDTNLEIMGRHATMQIIRLTAQVKEALCEQGRQPTKDLHTGRAPGSLTCTPNN